MKLRILLPSLAALVSGTALMGAATVLAQAPPVNVTMPPPTAGTKLATGLLSPRGMKLGPDGMIYVAEAGTGGTTAVGSGDNASTSGSTGRISKVDPATGTRTTVADGLPSNGGMEGDVVGPADVAFIGNQLYYIQTHGGAAYGFPSTPTGLYKVNSNGTTTLVADIGAFNIANPVTDVSSGRQPDIETGGNPYAMTVRDGAFFVTDGNQNQIMKITTAGTITRLNEFPGHPVTTGIGFPNGGPFYVAALGQFPFSPENGKVYQVGYPSGTVSVVASGVSSLTGLAVHNNGNVYVSNFGDQATNPNGPPWQLFTAKIMRVDTTSGKLVPIVSGYVFTTALLFIGDTLYVTNDGINAFGTGEIWKIANFSTLAPLPAATPTAVPAAAPSPTAPSGTTGAGISGPNTGTGPGSPDGDTRLWALALALGVLGLGAIGAAFATKRA